MGNALAHLARYGFPVLLAASALAAALNPSAQQLYYALLVVSVLAILWGISPTRVLYGKREWGMDTFLTLLIAVALASDVVRVMRVPYDLLAIRLISPIGLLLLLITSVWLSRTMPVKPSGALAIIRQQSKGVFRDLSAVLGLLLLMVGLVRPLLLFAASLVPVFAILVAALGVLRPDMRKHAGVLVTVDGVLLAIAGLLVLRLLLALTPNLYSLVTLLRGAIGTLTVLALIAVLVIPAMMWRTLLLLRATKDHVHLPTWPAWLVGIMTGLVTLVILTRAIGAQWTGELTVTIENASTPLVFAALGIGLFCWALGTYSDGVKRVLMLFPFAIGTFVLLLFGVLTFISEFLASGAIILLAASNGWYASTLSYGLLFAATGLTLILGACGFVYEVVRD